MKPVFTIPATGRAVLTACAVMAVNQLSGYGTIMYYSANSVQDCWLLRLDLGGTVDATNFLFSEVNLFLIDPYRRQAIIRITVLGMAISLLIVAVAFTISLSTRI